MKTASCQTKFLVAAILTVQVLLSGAGSARADIYSYVDRNNVVHFTNVPTTRRYKVVFRDVGAYDHVQISPSKLRARVERVAKKYGVDPLLIMAMIKVESNFMPYAISSAGAVGLMQLLPSTARSMDAGNLYTPKDNIEAGVRYFKYLFTLFNGDYI